MDSKHEGMHKTLEPESHHEASIRMLHRVLTWTDEGVPCEADQRHDELVVRQLNEGANPLVHPRRAG